MTAASLARLRRVLCGLLLYACGVPMAAAADAAPPGTLTGQFLVSSIGAASYDIQLSVPPGTNGMEPQLGVQYNNLQADGVLGLGFSLTGLSSIERCAATLPLDGYIGTVSFDAQDRFCLDGTRLILVGGGIYGGEGTRYHTESESWTEVVAQQRCGSGPCSLVARNKDGWTLEFGTTPQSRMLVPGKNDVISWQIARIVDLNGNTVEVDYAAQPGDLENMPSAIRYTINTGAGLAAQRAVRFDYEPQPQAIPKYEGGARFLAARRMRAIRTEVDGSEVLRYAFGYAQSANSGRSLLQSITTCAANGDCLPPTRFEWQDTRNAVITPNGNASGELIRGWCKAGDATSVDFNGDGRPDLLCTREQAAFAQLSTGTGLKPATNQAEGRLNLPQNWCPGDEAHMPWADFNGDQKADLLCSTGDSKLRGLLSTGSGLVSPNGRPDGTFTVPNAWCEAARGCRTRWLNFDGDGRADASCDCDDGSHRVLVSDGRDLRSPNQSADGTVATGFCTAQDAQSFWSDFNGDGQTDLHCRAGSVQSVLVSDGKRLRSPNSSASGILTTNWCGGDAQIATLDFNGDGLRDLYCRHAAEGLHQVMLSGGDRVASPNRRADGTVRSGWCAAAQGAPDAGDFNADGLDDIACAQNGGRQLLMISTGSELRPPAGDPNGLLRSGWCASAGSAVQLTDFNGDAMTDLWCADRDTGVQSALVHEAPYPDLVNRIRDGLGGAFNIDYKPLTDDAVYTRGAPVQFPLLDVRTPIHVVAGYTQEDGRGAAYRYAYRYEGARTHLLLRRWLGFAAVRRTTLADGRYTVTGYVQDYPVVGFIGTSHQYSANGTLLTSARLTPTVLTSYPNVSQVLRGSETSSTYTRGTADYVFERRYEYDQYGNPALISDLGNTADPGDDLFDCWTYENRTGADWRIGYLRLHKSVRTAQACRDFLAAPAPQWNADTDLRFERTGYDARMNVTERSVYDDRNAIWLTQATGYDALGNTVSLTDWAGKTTRIEADARFRTFTAAVISPDTGGGNPLTVRYTHEPAFGNQLTETDPNGNTQKQVFDGLGRLTEEWGPDPAAADGKARVRLATHRYDRDSRGNFMETRERRTWNGADAADWPYIRVYVDGMNRPFRTDKTGAEGIAVVVTEQTYDALARPWRTSYPRAGDEAATWSTTWYDVMDRQVRVEQGDGTVQTFEYLQGELQVRSTIAAGTPDERVVVSHNSVRDTLLRSIGRNDATLRYEYDPILQTRRVTGANGDVTTLAYDSAGRVVESRSADTGAKHFVYGTDGRLHESRDAVGNVARYRYDALGRVTERSAEGAAGTRRYVFHYDAPQTANGRGQLTGVDGPAAREQYSYTRYGQIAGERLEIDGSIFQQQSSYAPDGELASMVYPDGAVLEIERDAQGNIVRQRMRESAAAEPRLMAEFGPYSALNQPRAARYGNGTTMQWRYYPYAEALARPHTVSVSDAGARELQRDTLSWNAAGQVSARTLKRHDLPELAFRYTYDAMGWLKRAEGGPAVFAFEYDQAGNVTLKDGVRYRYRSDSNQLEGGDDGLRVEHDGNGNVSRLSGVDADWRYGYDSENAMAQVTRDGASAQQADYDHDGRRLKRIDADGTVSLYVSGDYDVVIREGRSLHTRYVHGPQGRIAAFTTDRSETAHRAAVDWSGMRRSLAMLGTGQPLARGAALLAALPYAAEAMAWRSTLPWMLFWALWLCAAFVSLRLALRPRRYEESRREHVYRALAPWVLAVFLFAQAPAAGHAALAPGQGLPTVGERYFSSDHLGSIGVVTDAQGSESSLVAYLPFGAIDEPASSGPDDFRPKFGGKELDADSGLYYFDARYQHPGLGRFLQPDPALQFSSPYAYAGNDPLTLADPDGEVAFAVVVAVMAVIGATVGAYSGAASVNHSMNPANWDWSAGSTYTGLFAGAAIGAVGGAAGPVAAEAGVAVGIVGEVLIGAGENAAFTALGGGSPKEIIESALIGGVTGGLSAGIGAGVSRVASRGSRFAQRGEAALMEETSLSTRSARRSSVDALSGEASGFENRTLRSTESSSSGRRALSPAEIDDTGFGGEFSCFSFAAGTPIAAVEGAQAVESIRAGAQVWARDDSGTVAPFRVTAAFERAAPALLQVSTGGGVLRTTPEHPFWVLPGEWVAAGKLEAGQQLLARNGDAVEVLGVHPLPDGGSVYNFEVQGAHTYFAGDDEVLVHNPAKCSRRLKAMGRTPGKNSATGRNVEAAMKSKGWIKKIGKTKYVKVVITSGGPRVWRKIDSTIHMGHIVDAVGWWNKTGYKYGARAKQVRAFMLDALNYEFEYGPLNSSNGAKLGQTYRAPLGHVGPWP